MMNKEYELPVDGAYGMLKKDYIEAYNKASEIAKKTGMRDWLGPKGKLSQENSPFLPGNALGLSEDAGFKEKVYYNAVNFSQTLSVMLREIPAGKNKEFNELFNIKQHLDDAISSIYDQEKIFGDSEPEIEM